MPICGMTICVAASDIETCTLSVRHLLHCGVLYGRSDQAQPVLRPSRPAPRTRSDPNECADLLAYRLHQLLPSDGRLAASGVSDNRTRSRFKTVTDVLLVCLQTRKRKLAMNPVATEHAGGWLAGMAVGSSFAGDASPWGPHRQKCAFNATYPDR